MKIAFASPVSKSSHTLKRAVLLCLLFSLAVSACGTPAATGAPAPTAVLTPTMLKPTIETGGPCKVALGKTMPLAVKGMSGVDVVYRWTATAGNVNPADGPAVTYIAPDTPQDVIIRVEVEKDGVTSDATITCTVTGPTPTPMNTETPTPTLTPIPSPTRWACTSSRSEKLQNADIPGQVTIDTPQQGTSDIRSGQNVQSAGSYTGIPAGQYLWVFIYSADAGLHGRYYPQTKDAAKGWQPEPTTGQDGLWSLKINFGAPNLCYEVIVLVADAEASQSIADQLQRWAAVNNYSGYELNGPATANPPDAPGFPDGLEEKASIEVRTR